MSYFSPTNSAASPIEAQHRPRVQTNRAIAKGVDKCRVDFDF
jgi:hypothetical protein